MFVIQFFMLSLHLAAYQTLTLHIITVTTVGHWSHLCGPTQKDHVFKQPLNKSLDTHLRPNVT